LRITRRFCRIASSEISAQTGRPSKWIGFDIVF
jgi:hypothetical protein